MAQEKRKYYVYRVGEGTGCYARNYKVDYVGSAWAVSAKQACNFVRYRVLRDEHWDLTLPLHDSGELGSVEFHLTAFEVKDDPYAESARH